MADNNDDPTRWSHSTGEERDFQERIAASNRSSNYSGTAEEATFGVINKSAQAFASVLSSDEAAWQKREDIKKEKEERKREEREEEEKEEREREKEKEKEKESEK